MVSPAVPLRAHNRRALALLALGAVVAIALHASAGHGYPVPWPDEIDFITPAVSLARHGSLHVPQLGAPQGMYWMSDLYYFLLTPVFRLGPATLDSARAVSLVAILVAAGGFWSAARRFGASPSVAALVIALWLASPRVVLAGNIARHEALLLAFVAWSIAATADRRRLGALTLAGFAAVLHPAGIAFAIVILAANAHRDERRAAKWEWAAAGLLAAVVLFEIVHFAANASLAIDQLRFQAQRKANRNPALPMPLVALALVLAAAALNRFRRVAHWPSLFLATVAFAGLAIFQIGQEMWYQVYNQTAALCVVLAMLVAAATRPATERRRITAVAAGAMALLVFAVGGYGQPFYGMRFRQHSKEWDAFVVDVQAELQRISATSLRDRTVVINALSGLPWPAETDSVGRLRIVKQTLVTDAPPDADYLLYARTVCCTDLAPNPPMGTVVLQIVSANKSFDATFIDLRATDVTRRPFRAASS